MCNIGRIGKEMRIALLTLALVIALGGTAWADRSSPLIGKKVRLFVPSMGHKPISGQLTRIDQDSVFLRNYRLNHYEVTAVPKAEIDGCDVRAKGKPHAALGVCLGALVGVGAWVYQRTKDPRDTEDPNRHSHFWPVIYIGGGGVIGGFVGAMIRPAVWRPVSIWDIRPPEQSGGPMTGGLTLTLQF